MAHPTWAMGPVITINSATLMNKGLEVIEAQLLFDVPYERISVVVHPQSVVHSMVEFVDGSTVAQASPPDMRLPIAMALGWPRRVPDVARPLRLVATLLVDVRATRRHRLPCRTARQECRCARWYGSGGAQRSQRGLRRRVPGRGAVVPRHRRHRGSRAVRASARGPAPLRGRPWASTTCWPPTRRPAPAQPSW
jgi:hypothetical protein